MSRSNKQSSADMTGTRLPPQNLVAEQSLLGSVILENACLDDVLMVVDATKFYSDINGAIFSAIVGLLTTGKKADVVTLAEELQRRGVLEEFGGPPYLLTLLETVPHAAHAVYYAGIIADKWKLRQLQRLGMELVRLSDAESESTEEAIGKAETTLQLLSDSFASDNQSLEIGDLLLGALDEKVRCAAGLNTGFKTLDEKTNGLQGGEMVIVAARPTVGKSAFVGNIIANVTAGDVGVLLFSLEMSKNELIYRMVASLTGLTIRDIKRTSNEFAGQILDAMNTMNKWKLLIDDRPSLTVAQIAATARVSMRRHKGTGLIVIDYLQLIIAEDKRANREQQVATMTRGLKILARQLGVPILLLSQINRDADREKRVPRLSDLRESGAIEQDADGVWFLHRPGMSDVTKNDNEALLIVAKNRQGPTGNVNLTWDGRRFQFGDNGEANRSASSSDDDPSNPESWHNR